jgi:hypothetical protein
MDDYATVAPAMTASRHRWWKVRSLQTQRQNLGLSLVCCAFLLNTHETSLMNLEMGADLPSSDLLCRMQLLGFVPDDMIADTVVLQVSEMEQAVYRHVAGLPLHRRMEFSDDLTFYLSGKRLFDEVVRREVVLRTLVQVAQT